MKLHKHFPPHLSQLVFLDKNGEIENMSSLDYDLFLWLIYYTHKEYRDDKSLEYVFEYKDIKESFKKSLNTKSIKNSLEKIGGLQILSNYLKSYGDKETIITKPFKIKIITNKSNKSYGFSVTTTNLFMEYFNNPSPKVDVDYKIMYTLKPFMSKLLYLFLRDSYGGYKDVKRFRIVEIKKLRHMMNVWGENTTNSNFITQLKKSIVSINENSNINVDFTKKTKLNPKSGNKEIISIRFSIELDDMKLLKKRVNKSQPTEESTDTDEVVESDTVSEEKSFEEYVEDKVTEGYDEAKSKGIEIKNSDSYKNGIRKKLLENKDIKSEFTFVSFIENEKSKLKSKITDNQPYMIVLKDSDNFLDVYSINNEYQFVRNYDNSIVTKTIKEGLEFIEDKLVDLFYFDTQRCDYSDKNRVGRI